MLIRVMSAIYVLIIVLPAMVLTQPIVLLVIVRKTELSQEILVYVILLDFMMMECHSSVLSAIIPAILVLDPMEGSARLVRLLGSEQ
jgi:hypothetical protein